MKISSVDPGLTGAGAFIVDGTPENVFDMPQTGGKLVDFVKLTEIIISCAPDVGVIEQVHASPGAGVSGMFYFGANFGGPIGIFAGLGIPLHQITPQKWKTIHGLIGKPKDAARLLAIKKFPEWKDTFKLKKSVDKCDALLMGLAWLKLYGDREI